MSKQRIYLVADTVLNLKRLVRASTPAQSLGHVVKNRFTVKVASQDDIVDARDDGVAVETAGELPPDPPAGDPPSDPPPVDGNQQTQPEASPQAAAA